MTPGGTSSLATFATTDWSFPNCPASAPGSMPSVMTVSVGRVPASDVLEEVARDHEREVDVAVAQLAAGDLARVGVLARVGERDDLDAVRRVRGRRSQRVDDPLARLAGLVDDHDVDDLVDLLVSTQPSSAVTTSGTTNISPSVRSSRRKPWAMRRAIARIRRGLMLRLPRRRRERVALGVEAGQGEERGFEVGRAGPRPELRAGPPPDHLAVAHEHELVAAVGLVHDVARDEDRRAGRSKAPEVRPELDAERGVDADRRLVEEDHLGLVHERAREREPAAHAAGELQRGRPLPIAQLDEVEHAVDRRAVRRPWRLAKNPRFSPTDSSG